MTIIVRKHEKKDIKYMIEIWNEVVLDGIAFPQIECLSEDTGREFFAEQSYCGVAENLDTKELLGLYILHPNNIGRCGHICNASYGVKSGSRGMNIGKELVKDSMNQGKKLGFKILQFNAVVKTNKVARHLYEKLGFISLGIIPNGFLMKDGTYEDIVPYYCTL